MADPPWVVRSAEIRHRVRVLRLRIVRHVWVLRAPELRRELHLLLVAAVLLSAGLTSTGVTGGAVLLALSPLTPRAGSLEELPRLSRVFARDGTELGTLGPERREHATLEQVPEHVRHAVLAAEDARFYIHSGLDLRALAGAVFDGIRGNGLRGGSTITQQLAKINYTGTRRTLWRKLREAMYAQRLERSFTKDELLQRYLNQVYLGRGAYGIVDAARTFLGTTVDRLTAAQAATLAGKIRSPDRLDPWTDPDEVTARRDGVLRQMHRRGWLSSAELLAARREPLGVASSEPPLANGSRAPHFLEQVRREVAGLRALGSSRAERRHKLERVGGLRIETTLDVRLQDAATSAVRAILGAPDDPVTAVVSVEPGIGAIRAYVAGLDPSRRFDVAGQGRRQPGSVFKPFAYLAALEAGISPQTRFRTASPMTVDCGPERYPVRNYAGSGGGGKISVDRALVRSVNVVFAQLAARVGPDAVRVQAERAGIDRDALRSSGCAIALGGLDEGISPLEAAAAYATFAARGTYAEPYAISRIVDRRGRVLYEASPRPREALSPQRVGILNRALIDAVRRGTGTAAAIGRPVAGKTGTTNDHADAWFVGFVPQLSTAVWIGDPSGHVPMPALHGLRVAGGTFPARIFARYMRVAVQGMRVEQIHTSGGGRQPQRAKHSRARRPASPADAPEPDGPALAPAPERPPPRRPEPQPDPGPLPLPGV